MKKLTGTINEGWLGEDRTSKQRENGTEYVMDISIGPTCRVVFTVQARSLDEAKDIIRMQMQYHIDWPQEQLTPIESFWSSRLLYASACHKAGVLPEPR